MFKFLFTYIWPFTWLNRRLEAIDKELEALDKAWADHD